jgi:hypothetical protein
MADPIHIKLSDLWELVVNEDGIIALAHAHGDDHFLMQIGCLGCAGVPNAQVLEEGVNVIRSAGWSMAKPN